MTCAIIHTISVFNPTYLISFINKYFSNSFKEYFFHYIFSVVVSIAFDGLFWLPIYVVGVLLFFIFIFKCNVTCCLLYVRSTT